MYELIREPLPVAPERHQEIIEQNYQEREETSKYRIYDRELSTPAGGGEFKVLQKSCYVNSANHGFWDNRPDVNGNLTVPPNFSEKLQLMGDELSEAHEHYRSHREFQEVFFTKDKDGNMKPDGIPIELADCMIRILDFCGWSGIDLWSAVQLKREYNAKRPHMHGRAN